MNIYQHSELNYTDKKQQKQKLPNMTKIQV